MTNTNLQDWGAQGRAQEPARSGELGRVVREDRRRLRVMTARGERAAAHRGKAFAKDMALPQVGDWVVISKNEAVAALAQMIETLPRTSEISRLTSQGAQIIAANVDEAWLLVDASRTPNLAALERYLIAIEESGANAVVVVSKIDLECAWQTRVDELQAALGEIEVLAASALLGTGMRAVVERPRAGLTYCLMGASGTGKSTLINRLADRQIARTGEVRSRDRKGRHVTTHRELFRLPGGALFIDTPGMRELVPALPPGARPKRFDRIFEIARDCRFPDCRHELEPDCAVRQAARDGRLPASLVENYSRLSSPPAVRTRSLMRSQSASRTD